MNMTMPPILEFPGRGRSILQPSRGKRSIPERCVLCFFHELIQQSADEQELAPVASLYGEGEPRPVYCLGRGRDAVALAWPGLTAPFAAAVLEELVALGGRSFIACGGAGVLDSRLPPGRLVVPTSAIRDEGTSYHYLPAARSVRPSRDALEAIEKTCRTNGVEYSKGKTWTTDGLFRETRRQIERRRSEGCLTVEMEAAAFFAVARFRRVRFAQILYAGDDVSGSQWDSRDWRRSGSRSLAFRLAIEAVRRL